MIDGHKDLMWRNNMIDRYKDPVECDRIMLKAFRTSHMLCTYRTSSLGDDFLAAKAEVNARRTVNFSRDDAQRQSIKPSSLCKSCM